MSDTKFKLLPDVETERLITIINNAEYGFTKVWVAVNDGSPLLTFDLLDIAKELANRFPNAAIANAKGGQT